MNKAWSEKNKKIQTLISKEGTFDEGINVLLEIVWMCYTKKYESRSAGGKNGYL